MKVLPETETEFNKTDGEIWLRMMEAMLKGGVLEKVTPEYVPKLVDVMLESYRMRKKPETAWFVVGEERIEPRRK